jgi:hypothetical protein
MVQKWSKSGPLADYLAASKNTVAAGDLGKKPVSIKVTEKVVSRPLPDIFATF